MIVCVCACMYMHMCVYSWLENHRRSQEIDRAAPASEIGRQEAGFPGRVSRWVGPSFCFSFGVSENTVDLLA